MHQYKDLHKQFQMHYIEIKELAAKFRKNPKEAEMKLWKFIRNKKLAGRRFLRQHPVIYQIIENDCYFFITDFYCDKEMLIIEMDGGIHDCSIEKDNQRDKILQNLGFCVLHIRNEELSDIESVLVKIKRNFGRISIPIFETGRENVLLPGCTVM
jgi:leucyl-tRNA synthetase